MKLVRILLLPFAFLCVGFMRLLWRFDVRIRLGEIFSPRIGHMAGNTECYLCEKEASSDRYIDILYHSGSCSNKFLARMINRAVPLVDRTKFSKLVALCNTMFNGWQKHIAQPSQLDRDIYNLFEKQPPHLSFTEAEHRKGKDGLWKLGIPANAKWVCLIVRDSAYLPQLPYHSFRDAKIETYRQACDALTSRGYYVLRMGAKVEKPLASHNPRIIDFSQQYDDFMSTYLGANCAFCVSTGCGFDAIPYIFRRPICYTNYVPLEYLFTFYSKSLAIWKHHMKNGKRMTLDEIYKSGAGQFMKASQFEEAEIKLVDNTPEEITEVVLEMARGIENDVWGGEQEFWKSFPRSISPYNQKPLHGEIRMKIGSEFLKGYQ